jgi:hypothetical protein
MVPQRVLGEQDAEQVRMLVDQLDGQVLRAQQATKALTGVGRRYPARSRPCAQGT